MGEQQQFVVAVVEHRSSLSVGLAALAIGSARLVLARVHDSGSYVETLTQLMQLQPVGEIVLCQTNSGSSLAAKIRATYGTASTVAVLPRGDFNEVQGALLLRQFASAYSPVGPSVYLDSSLFLAHAALAALVKHVQRGSAAVQLVPGTLAVTVTPGAGRVFIDPATVQHLELVRNNKTHTKDGTLLQCLDHTKTKGGRRLLINNIVQPLGDARSLADRLDAVEEIVGNEKLFFALTETLKASATAADFEALAGQLCTRPRTRGTRFGEQLLRRVVTLKVALSRLRHVAAALEHSRSSKLLRAVRAVLLDKVNDELLAHIGKVLDEDCALGAVELNFAVRPNIDPFLDVARKEYTETAEDIRHLFRVYQQAAGDVSQLQLRHSKKAGFFVECADISALPQQREPLFQNLLVLPPQTAQGGRSGSNTRHSSKGKRQCFTTKELSSLSKKNADAAAHVVECSGRVLERLVGKLGPYAPVLVRIGEALSRLDLMQALATFAVMCPGGACRPEFTEHGPIAIKQGRHPFLSTTTFHAFIPNDVYQAGGVQLITGPNMSGKSTYLRLVGLLAVLAHIGSFVPAEFASFRLLTHVLSRMGGNEQQMDTVPHAPAAACLPDASAASQADSDGQSSAGAFFTEVQEVCTVLSLASDRALVLIDEFGRATSATGGAALAWAVAEHLAVKTRCLCFFVTHFFDVVQGLELLYGEESSTGSALVTTRHFLVDKKDGVHPLFALSAGVSSDYLGVEMAESSGLPPELIRLAYNYRARLRKKARDEEEARRRTSKCQQQEALLTRRAVAQQLLNLQHSTLDEQGLRAYLRDLKSSMAVSPVLSPSRKAACLCGAATSTAATEATAVLRAAGGETTTAEAFEP